jgi:hypothetical protein
VKKRVLEYFVVVGDGKGSHFMHLLPNALHLTLQARYLQNIDGSMRQHMHVTGQGRHQRWAIPMVRIGI